MLSTVAFPPAANGTTWWYSRQPVSEQRRPWALHRRGLLFQKVRQQGIEPALENGRWIATGQLMTHKRLRSEPSAQTDEAAGCDKRRGRLTLAERESICLLTSC
ncbi:MAG: hypothetical protein WD690_03595 [Vicinamibacterales bacterium]